ncbi:MAG: ubiquinol-cytochrome c reductase iron-sulfur subunit [Actinomycetota bacterium]
MSPGLLAALVVAASVLAWVAFMGVLAMGARMTAATEAPAAEKGRVGGAATPQAYPGAPPPEPEPKPRRKVDDAGGVTRRQFLNRAYFAAFGVAMLNFALASLDFVWPRLRGGFGTKITVNVAGVGEDVDAIKAHLASTRTPEYISDGRLYIMTFEGDSKKASNVHAYRAANTVETGIVAIYRKCPHLGCSVPWCAPAKWFECPCHGSKYSINGEYRDGPAPRAMDRFPVAIVGGKIEVDTSQRLEMPRGVVTSQPQPEGEHCVEVREG